MTASDQGDIDPRLLLGEFPSDLWFPRYAAGEWAPWSMRTITMLSARGYWGQTYRILGTAVLSGPVDNGRASWMSIVPAEVESQEIGIATARGHTVVLGLGMGWCAANVALRPEVERVTVIERDPQVIALIEALGIFGQLPADARAKIEVVQADALEWRPDARVDSLQADFWARYIEPQKWNDVYRIHENIGAESLYFWGQEMELWRIACQEQGRVPERLERGDLDRLIQATGLPLVTPDWPDYGDRIVAAAEWWTPRDDGWWDDMVPRPQR